MSEMIERVAKAICPWNAKKRDNCPTDCRVCLTNAYLAVKAMREPNVDMLVAVAPFPAHLASERDDVGYTKSMEAATISDRMTARSTYQAMIDAALPQDWG